MDLPIVALKRTWFLINQSEADPENLHRGGAKQIGGTFMCRTGITKGGKHKVFRGQRPLTPSKVSEPSISWGTSQPPGEGAMAPLAPPPPGVSAPEP